MKRIILCCLMVLLWPHQAQAANGQCKWEGGPGASGLTGDSRAYCRNEDCIENGGLAICTSPQPQPTNTIENADAQMWTYNICGPSETFNSCAKSAQMCRAAGGTPTGSNFCGCEGLSDAYINSNPTALRNETPILQELINYAQLGASCISASLALDTGFGFPNTDSPICGPRTTLKNNIPIVEARRVEVNYGVFLYGQCIKETARFTVSRYRKLACPAGFWQRNLPGGDIGCYKSQAEICPVGNPVQAETGAKVQIETDYADAGAGGLDFKRYYSSQGYPQGTQANFPGAVNAENVWRHNWQRELQWVGSGTLQAVLRLADGRLVYFGVDGNAIHRNASSTERLASNGSGWIYSDGNGLEEIYDSHPRLIQVRHNSHATVNLSYDAQGRVERVTDWVGRYLHFTYNAAGLLETIWAPDGSPTYYGYTQKGVLNAVRYGANGATRSYLYGDTSNDLLLTGIIGEDGNLFKTYTYANGRVTSSQAPGGLQKYSYDYNIYSTAQRTITSITQPNGVSDTHYNELAGDRLKLSRSTAPIDDRREYDAAGNMVSRQTGNFHDCYQYDVTRTLETARIEGVPTSTSCTNAFAMSATQLGGNMRRTDTQWHPTLRKPLRVTTPGLTQEYTYDSRGNLISEQITDSLSTPNTVRTRSWTYTEHNQLASHTDAAGGLTQLAYDARGNLTRITDALGRVTRLDYNAADRVASHTTPAGTTTQYTYDARGRLTSSTIAGLATQFSYLPTGLLASVTQPNGHRINYLYDPAHQLTGWTDNRGNQGTYILDGMGNKTAEEIRSATNERAYQLSRTLNALNKVATETEGDSQSISFTYDNRGQLITQTNGLNQRTTYTVDGLRRIAQITDPLGATFNLSYNALDAIIQAKDGKSVATVYARDGLGNAAQESSLDIGVVKTEYDALGLPRQITDALGQTTRIERDALGRPVRIRYADGKDTTLSWDRPESGAGLAGFVDRTGSTAYTRDLFGRVTSQTQTLANGSTQTIGYSYTPNGQLSTITYPSGAILGHQYDATGRLVQLNWNGAPLITGLQWNPLGQPTAWTWAFGAGGIGNGLDQKATRNYDSAARLTQVSLLGTPLLSYQYDNAGRITSLSQSLTREQTAGDANSPLTASLITWSAVYDSAGRITGLNTASGTPANLTSQLTTGYDANGNRTNSSETSAGTTTVRNYTLAANRPSGFTQKIGTAAQTSIAYQYNANGDLTSDGLRSYAYDAGGRLASVTTGSGPSAPTTKYAHNALGQRVFKTEALYAPEDQGLLQSLGSFFTSLWGGQSEAEKLGWAYVYSEDGTLLTEQGMGGPNSTGNTNYIWLPTASGPMPVAVEMNGQLYAVHADHLNTPRALTRPDGTITWQWAMSAWGQTPATSLATRFRNETPPQGTPSFNLRFPGQQYDQESGLHFNGYRSYDPRTGRYPQPDPIGLNGGWNRYAYVNGNPLLYTDPLGLQSQTLAPSWSTPELQAVEARLQLLANKAADTVDATCGWKCNLPWIRGTLVHSEFKRLVDKTCPADYSTEVSYKDGSRTSYGTEGSSRADVVYGPVNAPKLVFDLKTGWAYMSVGQAKAYGANLPANTPFTIIRPEGR